MTLISFNTLMAWPGHCESMSVAPAVGSDQTLTTAGHYQAWVGAARESMTITHIGFRAGAVTTSGVLTAEVRVETVDASGIPSGTLFNSGTTNNCNATTAAITSNTWVLTALTGSCTIAAGQMFAMLVKFVGSTSITLQRLSGPRQLIPNLPYEVTTTSGSAVKTRLTGIKLIVAGSSSTTFYSMLGSAAANSAAANAFNNTSSARRGLRFQVPFKCRCVGIRHYQGTAAGDYNARLDDDTGNELSTSSTAYDGDHSSANAGGVHYSLFDSPVTLSAATWYRAVLEPSSATNINMYTATLPSTDYKTGWQGGSNQHYTTFATSLPYDDTATTQIALMDILIDQVDDGTGSGVASVGVIGS